MLRPHLHRRRLRLRRRDHHPGPHPRHHLPRVQRHPPQRPPQPHPQPLLPGGRRGRARVRRLRPHEVRLHRRPRPRRRRLRAGRLLRGLHVGPPRARGRVGLCRDRHRGRRHHHALRVPLPLRQRQPRHRARRPPGRRPHARQRLPRRRRRHRHRPPRRAVQPDDDVGRHRRQRRQGELVHRGVRPRGRARAHGASEDAVQGDGLEPEGVRAAPEGARVFADGRGEVREEAVGRGGREGVVRGGECRRVEVECG
mmetsp:Transcript_3796/g.9901  ORF Transcript_3796/g.9901 Transcript_3796/m.9901 type:complete len:254 (-) Transcript_3796:17-778(-)